MEIVRNDVNAKQRARYQRNRAEAIAALGGICAHCGGVDSLEFDHVDPTTKAMRIAKLLTRSREIRQAELEKCQLLCKSCHDEKSGRIASTTHGTRQVSRRCGPPKCEKCITFDRRRITRVWLRKLVRERLVTLTEYGEQFLRKSLSSESSGL